MVVENIKYKTRYQYHDTVSSRKKNILLSIQLLTNYLSTPNVIQKHIYILPPVSLGKIYLKNYVLHIIIFYIFR